MSASDQQIVSPLEAYALGYATEVEAREQGELRLPNRYSEIARVDTDSGHKGAWNRQLNRPEGNTAYIVNDQHAYVTDSEGRVEYAQTTLRGGGESSDRNRYQQTKAGGGDREDGDHGGHLFASKFGGPGESVNLVAMSGELNSNGRENWYELENIWAAALKEHKSVDIRIDMDYPADSRRPRAFLVAYKITGEPTKFTGFMNE